MSNMCDEIQKSYFFDRVRKYLCKKDNAIPVRTGSNDCAAVSTSLNLIDEGYLIR